MAQWVATPVLMAKSTTFSFNTGRAPGNPRQTGQVWELGWLPKEVAQPQKILVSVVSWAWTSSPMTTSYLESMVQSFRISAFLAGFHLLQGCPVAMPVRRLFVSVSGAQNGFLAEGLADELQADGQSFAENRRVRSCRRSRPD
jgi:hypothetical protein